MTSDILEERMDPHGLPARRVTWARWSPAGLAWLLWAVTVAGIVAVSVLDTRTRAAGHELLTQFAITPTLACLSAVTVGAVVASRRPRHPVGWLLVALAMSLSTSGLMAGYLPYRQVVAGGVPTTDRLAVLYAPTVFAAFACLGFIMLLTPTGALPSPRWRWPARVAAVAPTTLVLAMPWLPRMTTPAPLADNPFDFRAFGGPLLLANRAALALTLLTVLVGVAALVGRFRRAQGLERQQLRWVALAAYLTAACIVAVAALSAAGQVGAVGWAGAGCVVILPPTIGAAILRYRLYDMDRIVTRVVAYGLLTVVLGAVYAGAVLALAQLLGPRSSVSVAAATLAAAGVFQPARRHIQRAVDRRFHRRHYDAAATVHTFGALLRQELDLAVVASALSTVVGDTMQPSRMSLWLTGQPPGRRVRAR